MFGNPTVLAHILRGVIGFGALALAILLARNAGTASVHASVTLAIVALIALRGCPVCWTIRLFETLRGKAPQITGYAELPPGAGTEYRKLSKPFLLDDLEKALAETIESRENVLSFQTGRKQSLMRIPDEAALKQQTFAGECDRDPAVSEFVARISLQGAQLESIRRPKRTLNGF